MLLKFWDKNEVISLESKGEMLDISTDFRTSMLNKNEMTLDIFRVDQNTYMLRKNFFIQMAKKQNRDTIEALLIKHGEKRIIIIGDKSSVYYNGRAVQVQEYSLCVDENEGTKIASSPN